MATQVNKIYSYEENIVAQGEQNRFLACEEIIEELVEQGLPSSFVPDNFISKISKTYGISFQEAKTCLKLATKQLEANNKIENEQPKEELYAQSGYFYPQINTQKNSTHKRDGMDSLSSLGSYNKLMFGLR